MDQFESGHWLNKKRLTVYPRMILVISLITYGGWVLLSKNMVDLQGTAFGADFIALWAASHIGLTGHPQDAYNIPLLLEAERIAVPAFQGSVLWFYPPTFYLVVLPLALLPYVAAFFTFMLTTLAAYVVTFRKVAKGPDAMLCLAAFSGVIINLINGQNAFLTAALAAAALLWLERRPVLSGIFIGLLAIKPHMAVLFPVALIAIGAWRTFITAGLVATIFTAVSTTVLGSATLPAFLGSLSIARKAVEIGALPWAKMPTIFALLRMLGIPVPVAYIGHAVLACAAIVALWVVWRRSQALPLRGAALMTATFLVSPFSYDYDLAWLAFPIAWLAVVGLRDGWLRGEREVLVAAWVLPMIMGPIAKVLSIQVGPLVLAALLWVVLRRAGVWQETAELVNENETPPATI